MLAAAWRAFRGDRKGSLLGPGPAFAEAIGAAMEVAEAERAAAVGAIDLDAVAHEVWAAAQLVPGEGIADGAVRVRDILDAAVRRLAGVTESTP